MSYSPLIHLKPGTQGSIHHIHAGGFATKRLYEMGLYPGTKLVMVKNDVGPVILSLAGNRIALGRGLAQKILVE